MKKIPVVILISIVVLNDANRIWEVEKDNKNLLGRDSKRKSLIDQSAMMEIYARLSEL